MSERVRYRGFISDSWRWDGFEFRPDDIIISTPPKCGTTWTQMMCALLIFQTPDFPGTLAGLSPWLEMQTNDAAEIHAQFAAQTHRRFIKSHTPFDGLPDRDDITYVVVGRDLREVALSWANHIDNVDLDTLVTVRINAVGMDDLEEIGAEIPDPPPEDPIERFWVWVDDETPITDGRSSLRACLYHLESFWRLRDRPNVVLLHYSDLLADLPGEMRGLADALGIEVSDELLRSLAEAARFEHMKENADKCAPDVHNAIWKDNTQFFDRGTGRDWSGFVAAEPERYDARIAALTDDAEFVAWVHH